MTPIFVNENEFVKRIMLEMQERHGELLKNKSADFVQVTFPSDMIVSARKKKPKPEEEEEIEVCCVCWRSGDLILCVGDCCPVALPDEPINS